MKKYKSVKRELSNKEKKICNDSIKRLTKETKEITDNYDYNSALIEKQKYLREFDNKWRSYLQERKDEEDESILQAMSKKIYENKSIVNDLNKQITEGVTPKGYTK